MTTQGQFWLGDSDEKNVLRVYGNILVFSSYWAYNLGKMTDFPLAFGV